MDANNANNFSKHIGIKVEIFWVKLLNFQWNQLQKTIIWPKIIIGKFICIKWYQKMQMAKVKEFTSIRFRDYHTYYYSGVPMRSPRFYWANNSKFRAWRYQSHTQLQLCQIRLYMVSKQTSRKNVAVKDFDVLFLIWLRVKNWRKLKQIKVIARLTPRKCCFHFTKNISLQLICFLNEFI